jgi:hypothetical protein
MDTVRITLRLPNDVHGAVSDVAKTQDRSVNQQIVWLLRQALKWNDATGGQSLDSTNGHAVPPASRRQRVCRQADGA